MVKHHLYKGTLCVIEERAMAEFIGVVKEHNPQLIIELGTYYGGMTKRLSDEFPEAIIYSFDIVWMISPEDEKYLRLARNVSIVVGSELFTGRSLVRQLLSLPIKKFLFCDNGNRTEEIRSFAGLLSPGDLLGLHDWSTDIDYEMVAGPLSLFEAHEINEVFATDGVSDIRLFTRENKPTRTVFPWLEKKEKDGM